MISLPPEDYLERVYAGVLGKLIGVYMGRPFEGWTHQRILAELGHIRYFVNERLGLPIVVTDDDVSGTFTFVRALEEHSYHRDDGVVSGEESKGVISAEDVGKTWLNNVIKGRTIFWWGGHGVSTEHTAFLNLKRGIKAPKSGAISTNGQTIAEQIGAQIFIDGFAMAAPGNPTLAARLAGAAASVSHDGEAIHAARLWAAMEAEAFLSGDSNHLLDTGLRFVPSGSLIATLVADVRAWCAEDGDWLRTRQRIEDKYGYDKFPGICHVVPNHGIMVMALVYGGHDFSTAMHIVNTSGWDTDCNSGNLGCLVAIMHGLKGLEKDRKDDGSSDDTNESKGGPKDWRGPLSDRALISSADGGYSVNNAVRIAYDVANMGHQLAGEPPLAPPKDGAQFHFTLSGSIQGFHATSPENTSNHIKPLVTIKQGIDVANASSPGLAIQVSGLASQTGKIEVVTDTFAPPEVRQMAIYELVGSPLVYPGQTLQALVRADATNTNLASVSLLLKAYKYSDGLEAFTGDTVSLTPGTSTILKWTIQSDKLGSLPIQAVGMAVSAQQSSKQLNGTIWLDYLRWDGTPTLTLKPATTAAFASGDKQYGPATFYQQSFVNGADTFDATGDTYIIAQDHGEGIVTYGTREWDDYKAVFREFIVNIGGPVGVAVRVRGLNRWYGIMFNGGDDDKKRVTIIKAHDEQRVELAGVDFAWEVDTPYTITIEVEGDELCARLGDVELLARETGHIGGGGIGIVVTDGSAFVDSIEIGPLG